MPEAMGQIIRRLRKNKNLTQEELAEQLGVTFQAVSKWENGTAMPDISQIVPIAGVFGVSTDVLFGTIGVNTENSAKIINMAQSFLGDKLDSAGLLRKYHALQEGLRIYPNDTKLLLECLETGLALSYPENDVCDKRYADTIYRDCIYYANLIISYSKNTNEILRARMIMIMLHSAYDCFDDAVIHIQHFPMRADFNIHVMRAYYAHWKKDYNAELNSCQYGFLYYLEGALNILTRLSKIYDTQGKYNEATTTIETMLDFILCIFKDGNVMPPLHYREQGDLYMMLAEIYLKTGNVDKVLYYLEKMVDYDINDYEKIDGKTYADSPLLHFVLHDVYCKRIDRRRELIEKLTDQRFAILNENQKYKKLVEKATLKAVKPE